MKKNILNKAILSLLTLVLAIGFSSCHSHHHTKKIVVKTKRMPPGQAKKINGSKSAKYYAPGQRKK